MNRTNLGWPALLRNVLMIGVALFCWFFSSPVFDTLFSLIVLRVFYVFLRDVALLPRTSVVFLVLVCPLVLVLPYRFPELAPTPYLAVTLINLIVAFVFGNSLLRSRPNILIQFVKTAHLGPKPSKEFASYLRWQCVVWVAAGLLCAASGAIAFISETARSSAGTALLALVLAQLLWFVVSHEIARFRFGRPETWIESMRLITRRSAWEKLDI